MNALGAATGADGQLFHSYTTISDHDPTVSELARMVRAGRLRLFPHREVAIGAPIAWESNPLDDANWCFQFHSLVWLDRVRQAAVEACDDEIRDLYRTTLRSWLDANPVNDSRSSWAWFDMATGLRAVVLAFAVAEFGMEDWLRQALVVHGEELADASKYDLRGNHGLHQDMGLLVVGSLLCRDDWVAKATGRIEEMFFAAVDEQGVCREGSIDYQYRNFRWYQEAERRLHAAGVEGIAERMAGRLALMPEFLAHATDPAGNYAMIGDTLRHPARRIVGTVADWSRDPARVPAATAAVYDAGYLFARRNWHTFGRDEHCAYLTQRFGPGRASAVHGHEDAGAVTLDANGESLLRDSGLYAYEAGADRLFFRGRGSHSVIDVPGRAFYPSAEATLTDHSLADDLVFSCIRVSALQGVVWHRAMAWCPEDGLLFVDDRVRLHGTDDAVQQWQLPQGARTAWDAESGAVSIEFVGGTVMTVEQVGERRPVSFVAGGRDPIEGWVSEQYREMLPAPVMKYHARGTSIRLTTLFLYPAARGWMPELVSAVRSTLQSRIVARMGDRMVSVVLSSEGATRAVHGVA